MTKLTYEHIGMLQYFHDEKNDITRYCDFESLLKTLRITHPRFVKSFDDMNAAIRLFELELERLDIEE